MCVKNPQSNAVKAQLVFFKIGLDNMHIKTLRHRRCALYLVLIGL